MSLCPLIDGWETVEEMEQGLDLPTGSLVTTLDRYNEHAARGEDPDFHKHPDWLAPQDTGPWGAYDLTLGKALYAGFTLGGLRTTVDGQVQRPDGSVVGGLYAAGACASNLAQDGAGYCSGTQLGEGSFFGRRAGRHAAAGSPADRGILRVSAISTPTTSGSPATRGNRTAVASTHDVDRRPLAGGEPRQRAAVPRHGPAGRGAHQAADPRRPGRPAGRAAEHGRAGAGAGRGDPAAGGHRPARLHARGRDPRAAGGDRRPPPEDVRRRRRPRRGHRDHRQQRRVPAGVPRGVRGRRQGGDGPAGLPLLPQRAHRARHRGGRDPDRPGDEVPAHRRAGRGAARAARPQGAGRREPGQPDRHHAAPERARGAGPVVRGRAGAADQRRDLPRHRVRRGQQAGPQRLGDQSRGGRVRQLQQVLLDDRVADRLDAGAGAAAPGRATC